jgi:hypothetical protein
MPRVFISELRVDGRSTRALETCIKMEPWSRPRCRIPTGHVSQINSRTSSRHSPRDPIRPRREHTTYSIWPPAKRVLSSYPIDGQDKDFLRDRLRERIQSLLGSAALHVHIAEEWRETTGLHAKIDPHLARRAAFVRERVLPFRTS